MRVALNVFGGFLLLAALLAGAFAPSPGSGQTTESTANYPGQLPACRSVSSALTPFLPMPFWTPGCHT
jgi:hypothetical protein